LATVTKSSLCPKKSHSRSVSEGDKMLKAKYFNTERTEEIQSGTEESIFHHRLAATPRGALKQILHSSLAGQSHVRFR